MKARRPAVWYAVSAILAFERRRKPRFLVWENVYLVRARSPKEAARRGAALARREARVAAFAWDGEPVQGAFAGIRKVLWCAANPEHSGGPEVTTIHDGVEATFAQLLVDSKRDLRRLAEGKPVRIVYEE